MRPPGRTKIKLAKLLEEAFQRDGFPIEIVDPTHLMEATGYHRTSNALDNEALRWEAFVPRKDLPNVKIWLTSFATMTEIIKSGEATLTFTGPTQVWVDVRKQKAAA